MDNKKRFEVKEFLDHVTGNIKRDIFIDDKLFEYEVDRNSLEKARKLGPQYYIAAQRDIQKHFLDSLSDFLGRKVTATDVANARKDGFI